MRRFSNSLTMIFGGCVNTKILRLLLKKALLNISVWRQNVRLDFRRLQGPVFDPPRREALSGDECGLIFPNSGW